MPVYRENPPAGPGNLRRKLERAKAGGKFETDDMVYLNRHAARLASGYKNVCEVGSGTGMFAAELVRLSEQARVFCYEKDQITREWAAEHRRHDRVFYRGDDPTCEPFSPDVPEFDAVVSVEVIEHIGDFVGFLDMLQSLAQNAIITTTNRMRKGANAGPPKNKLHVREWSAGEFYWVLKCFYRDVELYGMNLAGKVIEADVNTVSTYLISVCKV